MKSRNIFLISILLMTAVTIRAELTVTTLKTDYKSNPIGVDNPLPKLSWIIQSDQMNTMQESYEIRAALDVKDLSRGRKLLWSTGQVSSSKSVHVKYGGPPLQSFQRIYWQVRIRDNHGKKSDWSDVAYWEMGILQDIQWEADWISPTWEEDPNASMPSPYLRKEFMLDKKIIDARLYISSQGLFQVEINGKRIGDQEFTPGWTSYDTRLQYQTYDVTKNLIQAENAIGIILGDGWFRGNLGWGDTRNRYGTQLATIAQLMIRFTDGSTKIITTNNSWKATTGPILESDIYNGELYDATKELDGWSTSGYNDSEWEPTQVLDISKKKLITAEGRKISVGERSKDLLRVLRLSYGLLGVVYEVTLRVRPIRAFTVYSNKMSFINSFCNLI